MKKTLVWLLTLFMVLTISSVTVFAAGTDVAKIGETGYATLQAAVDAAVDGDTIVLLTNVTEDVVITQKADLDLTIDGANKTYTGVMTVFGNGRQSGAETLTIKNIVFQAVAGKDSCILSPDRSVYSKYSYSHNVTVENCVFHGNTETPLKAAAIRHNDGGDKNWTIKGCTVDANMHSMLQTNNVAGKLVIDDCTVNSKNGLNLNSCTNVEITNCEINVKGYAVRAGVNSGGNVDEAKTFVLENNTLTTDNSEGDAVIVLRADAAKATVDMEQNSVVGATHISGVTDTNTVKADENYWSGAAAPVVSGTAVDVNAYYTDIDRTTLGYNCAAKIGKAYYDTLAAALAAAQAGDEVDLFEDITTSSTITIDKAITLDGNGKTITYTGSDRAIEMANSLGAAEITIKNLTVDCTASYCQRGINYNATGKLTLDNVTVKGTNVTYAVNVPGKADGALITITNCDLSGNIALNVWGKNCTINVTNTTCTAVDNNSAEGYAAVKLNNDGATSAENTVINIIGGKIDVTGTESTDTEAASNGTSTGKINISDTTVVNGEVTSMVAIIRYANDTSYSFETLKGAIEFAKDGETVILIRDITVSETITVDKAITLDLNGKTITGMDNATGSFGLININPGAELTITGNGKITLTAANNRAWNAYSSVISNQRGKLIIENGTIEHLGGTDMAYGIDNLTNGKGTYAETVINGGTIKSTYRAIRQFLNGVEAQNILTINAGTVYGANTGVFFQDPSAKANTGTLTIAAGAQVNGVYLFVTAGSTEWPVEVSIAGSAIGANGVTSKNIPEGYEVASVGGNYGVFNGVAKIATAYYETLEAAFTGAHNGDTIVLIADVNAAVTYSVNKTLTLDLSGYTIESDAAATLTATAGKLTIVDSSADQTGAIIGAKAIHSSAYVAIQSGKFVGAITTANNEADDSQVCITGGIFTVEPNANLLEHCYISVENEDGTFSVIEDEYEVIINANGGEVTGAGFYKFGETVYIYADKNGNYTFAGWLSEDVEIMNPGERLASFVMPDHEVVVTAYWASNGTTTPVIPVMRGTIHFETNGGSAINSYTGTYGAKVDLAQFVTIRQGYTFAGWYSDAALSKPVTQLTLGGTKTVYAGWIETPVIPDVPVVVLPFTDVAADAYYYNAVLWAVGMGITNGISDTAFGPDMVCTRAQVVTFLWRAAGCPVAQNDDMPFADVTRDMYYYDAVLWAVEQGITNGISDTEFGPDAECSRAQIVTFLWRSQGSPAVEADGEFHDVDADAYYATAVEWAVDNGVTNGVGDDAFAPDAECTRAQTVTFLYRHFCK